MCIMPLVIIEHNRQAIWDALLCAEDQKREVYLQLIDELDKVIGEKLIYLVEAKNYELALSAPVFSEIVRGRLPIEVTIQTTPNRFWNAPRRTKEISENIADAMRGLLHSWTTSGKANFDGWKTSLCVSFLGTFVESRQVQVVMG